MAVFGFGFGWTIKINKLRFARPACSFIVWQAGPPGSEKELSTSCPYFPLLLLAPASDIIKNIPEFGLNGETPFDFIKTMIYG